MENDGGRRVTLENNGTGMADAHTLCSSPLLPHFMKQDGEEKLVWEMLCVLSTEILPIGHALNIVRIVTFGHKEWQ